MSISDYVPRREPLKGHDGEPVCMLRGLSLPDCTALIERRLPEIEAAVNLGQAARASVFSRAAVDGLILHLIDKMPDLVAEVISIAADEPEARDTVGKLPAGLQAQALHTVAELTFQDAGGLKNLMATLLRRIQEALPAGADPLVGSPMFPGKAPN